MLGELCTDIVLETDFPELHKSITINYGASKPLLSFIALTTIITNPPELFGHLNSDCKPIASKARKYSKNDQQFIKAEVHCLAVAKIIYRTQQFTMKSRGTSHLRENQRCILPRNNKYTQLDAYPLLKIDEIVNRIANFNYYSTILIYDQHIIKYLNQKNINHTLLSKQMAIH